jgi:hypothetical protein
MSEGSNTIGVFILLVFTLAEVADKYIPSRYILVSTSFKRDRQDLEDNMI